MSRKPKPLPRGGVVLPTFTSKVPTQSMVYPQKQPSFSPPLKMDHPTFGGNFKAPLPYGAAGTSLQVCHMREIPVSSIPPDFTVG